MSAADRAYLREVFNTNAGVRFLAQLVAARPPIKGETLEQSAMSAREASGYERALANMSALITDPISSPEVKRVNIADD
jgi:hypothetical protein